MAAFCCCRRCLASSPCEGSAIPHKLPSEILSEPSLLGPQFLQAAQVPWGAICHAHRDDQRRLCRAGFRNLSFRCRPRSCLLRIGRGQSDGTQGGRVPIYEPGLSELVIPIQRCLSHST